MYPLLHPKRALVSLLSGLVLISVALSACNLPAATPAANDPNLVYTAAAQTVAAQLTQAANQQTATPTSPAGQPATATQPVVVPTNTPPAQTQPTEPAQTPVPPTATSVTIPCDRAEFVKDVTIPDDTEMAPGTQFIKTWRLRNNGSCAWNSGYSLIFHDKNALGGPAVVQLTTKTVEPGQTIDISVTLKAPNAPGDYESDWMLRNGSSVVFGIGAKADKFFWVKIRVTNTINYNFYTKAKDAQWRNGTDEIDFGDKNDDSPGVAAYVENAKLEDGKTYSKALATYPERIDDGEILGIFSPYTVKDGDHFVAQVGFRSGCENGKVSFQFGYMEGGSFQILKEWSKSCDGNMKTLDFDLADLEGEEHEFVLAVDAVGSFRNDKVMWIDPRIQKR
jgi:hypothetical protein